MFFTAFIALVCAYFFGSVNFAVIFTKIFANKDVRTFGSGNAGSTNALRVGGKLVGTLTFVCDFAKGALSALLGRFIFEYVFEATNSQFANPVYGVYLCGIACMIGHIFPMFFDFKGGKGVATGVGVILIICPIATVVGLAMFTICVIITKTVSLSSLVSTLGVIVVVLIKHDTSCAFWPQMVMAIIIGGLIFIKHKDNISRILSGEEKKFSFGGKNG